MTTKKMTVKDLAEYSNLETSEVIRRLSELAPAVNWGAKTPVPDEMAESYMKGFDEYKQASVPAGSLASSQMPSELAQVNYEANSYALMEAVAAVDLHAIITTAVGNTLNEIAHYESTKAKVWEGYIEQKMNASRDRQSKAIKHQDELAVTQKVQVAKNIDTAQALNRSAEQLGKEGQDFLTQVIASL
jgi:hypothetical protein